MRRYQSLSSTKARLSDPKHAAQRRSIQSCIRLQKQHLSQCDQVWRNFTTMAKKSKSFGYFLDSLFSIWQSFAPALAFLCHGANRQWPKIE